MSGEDEEVGGHDDLESLGFDEQGYPLAGEGSLAPIWRRALARLIDVFVIFNVAGLLTVAIVRPGADDRGFVAAIVVATVFFAIAGAYEAGMVAWRGQTLGKMLLHIRIARITNDAVPTLPEAVVRYAVPAIFLYFTFIVPLIGELLWVAVFLTAIPNIRRQGWHDRAAATVVLATR